MMHLILLCVITLSSIACNFAHPVDTSSSAIDPSVTEYTTDDVEYEDDPPDAQVSTKRGLIKCNISNSMTKLYGYQVQMSLVEDIEAEATCREYIRKYKLGKLQVQWLNV